MSGGESLPLPLLGKQFYQEWISGPEVLSRCLWFFTVGPQGGFSSPFLQVFVWEDSFLRWALLLSIE